jgi:hypothetical protein
LLDPDLRAEHERCHRLLRLLQFSVRPDCEGVGGRGMDLNFPTYSNIFDKLDYCRGVFLRENVYEMYSASQEIVYFLSNMGCSTVAICHISWKVLGISTDALPRELAI